MFGKINPTIVNKGWVLVRNVITSSTLMEQEIIHLGELLLVS